MSNVEIGIKINASVYLHIYGERFPAEFDITRIDSVNTTEFGTVIKYYEPSNDGVERGEASLYVVKESKEEILEAIEDAKAYKSKCIETVNGLLKKE